MKKTIQLKHWLAVVFMTFVSLNVTAQEINCVTGPAGVSPLQNTIDFSAPAVPCGPFQSYEVWGSETPSGAFSLIETINNAAQLTSVHDLPAGGGPIWYYYIVFNYNCPGNPPIISNTATNEFSNASIEIINVDIQENPYCIEITWQQSPYSQTVGYDIGILQANGTVIQIGSTTNITDTSFCDNIGLSDECGLYTISIIDGCGNPSAYNPEGYCPILITDLTQDRCEQLITLTWEQFDYPYPDAPNLTYNILVGNGSDTTVVANQALAATDFNFFDFLDGDTMYFRVELIDDAGAVRSTSEWQEIIAQIVQPPTDFIIEYLTVNAQNEIDVYYYIDTMAEITNFKLKNENQDVLRPSNEIRKDDFSILTQNNPNKYTKDTITDPNTGSYYYQVVANDSCNEDHYSTIGRTIFLEVTLADFFKNRVQWNEFELENASVSNYKLYRDFGAGMQLVQSFAPGDDDFMDNVEEYYNQLGGFCYRVDADYTIPVPNEGNVTYTSSSNTFCIEQRPAVYVPNAIAPNGVNNEFKPVIVFGNPTNYSMKIFNRWGELIFQSNSPENGWFGDKNGTKVVSGGYPYNITFKASDGTDVQKTGIVTVIY